MNWRREEGLTLVAAFEFELGSFFEDMAVSLVLVIRELKSARFEVCFLSRPGIVMVGCSWCYHLKPRAAR